MTVYLSGALESTPFLEGTPGPCLLSGCAVPMLGGPWRVHLSTLLRERWGESAPCCHVHTWRRGPRGTNPYVVGGGVWLPWEPVSSGGGRCRVRLLGGGLLACFFFSLLGFYFDVDKISTP